MSDLAPKWRQIYDGHFALVMSNVLKIILIQCLLTSNINFNLQNIFAKCLKRTSYTAAVIVSLINNLLACPQNPTGVSKSYDATDLKLTLFRRSHYQLQFTAFVCNGRFQISNPSSIEIRSTFVCRWKLAKWKMR